MKRKITIISITCIILTLAATFTATVLANGEQAALDIPEYEDNIDFENDNFFFMLEHYPQFETIDELKNFIYENISVKEVEVINDAAIRVRLSNEPAELKPSHECPPELDFENNYYLFILEHYPQFETIYELKDYICDKMSIKTAEIINDTVIRVQFLTDDGESKYPTHIIGELLGPTLAFSRHISSNPVLDYYHVYNIYACTVHPDCRIWQDTGERVAYVCAGASCPYN